MVMRVETMDANGRTPWILEVGKAHERIVEMFLSQDDIDFDRSFEYSHHFRIPVSVIHYVAMTGSTSMMQRLLQNDRLRAQLDRKCLMFQRDGLKGNVSPVSVTPLDIAKMCGHEPMVTLLEAKDVSRQ